ncbi:hypothetical protein [Pelovirga terrestris]|uniref:TIGR03016 family PEP-CTERM system-associated outer membrane protein n=1 Tax=Pelovirga terrestris TaxID=2771352 RepID=A0A8J6URD0_9BACT|nr:hypothetical protein [Pelovirga terrestris]MBD1401101.1 hypothetical protein [Pelovirga terrestris]
MHRVVFFLLVLLCAVPVPVTALDFNAYWLYRTSGGEERDTSDEFQQRYTLGVGPQLSWQPTHALSATATIGYTRTQRDNGDDKVKVEEITPSVNFGIINDLFAAQLAGSATHYRTKPKDSDIHLGTSRSWDATLSSRWQQAWWPNLRFNYGERDSGKADPKIMKPDDVYKDIRDGDLRLLPIESNYHSEQVQRFASADLDWDLRLLQLDYRYNTSWDEDISEGTDSERRNHFVRAATGGRFWDNRISYTFSHQFEDDRTQVKDRPGVGGVFDFIVPATVTTKVTSIVEDPTDPLYNQPADGFSPPLEVLPSEYLQIQIDADAGRQVDHLRLVFDDLTTAALLEWNIYRRDFISGDWSPVATALQGVLIDGYLELSTGVAGASFLLMARNTPLAPVRLSAVGAYVRRDTDDTDQRHLTNAGLQVRLTNSLQLAVNSTLERLRRDSGSDDDRSTLSARLRWTPRPWITPSLSYSESRSDTEDQDGDEVDQLSRSYSFNLATVPLPTMNLGFGVTRNDRYRNGDKTGAGWIYSISTTARLYPDLNTALFLSWRENDNWTRTNEGVSRTSDQSFSGRFNLNARLDRNLSADLTTSYRSSERESGSTEVADATLSVQYRPSSLLALRAFYTAYLLDSEQEDVVGGSANLALLRTDKARLNFSYNVTYAETLTNRFSLNGSWDISRALALQSRGGYTLAQTDFYDVQVSLNLRL